MANQMIALQARNPQLPDPARATTQMANMINLASQQRAAQLQGERARQEMEFARAGEAREVELQAPRLAKAQAEATGMDLKTVSLAFLNFKTRCIRVCCQTPYRICRPTPRCFSHGKKHLRLRR